ncbi:MAG: oligosaccharide flippase family protein [Sulfitobacter sp.]
MNIAQKVMARMPERSALGGRAMVASLWGLTELGASHFLRLASNLIMTRLLLPEAFGLMAMVTTLHVAMILLTDIGISQSITRSPQGDEKHYLRVTWVIQIFRSAIITGLIILAAAILWFAAPHLATPGTVYADPDLPGLIAVSAFVILMTGLASTNEFLAVRRMHLSRVAILNIATQVVSLVAMLALAQIEATVWTLLWGMMIGSAFHMVMSHLVFEGPRMGYAWDAKIASEVWHFGKWIMGASSLTFVSRNADRFILAALLDKESFGFYVIAIMWVQAFTMVVGKLIGQVGFPAFSEVLRDRPHDIKRVLSRFMRLIDGLCITGFVIFLLGGSFLITTLYPPDYITAASFMPFLALAILRERFNVLGQLLLSHGDSKAVMMDAGSSALMICAALPVAFHYMGIEGSLLVVALSPLAGAIPVLIRSRGLLGPDLRSHVIWFFAVLCVGALIYLLMPPL